MSQRWSQIEELFHNALALPYGQRADFLDNACDDDAMRREIEGLLAADDSGESLPPPFLPSTREFAPGSQLSHYQILGRIGQGGMGTVYRARDSDTGVVVSRLVAIKVFPPFPSSDHRRRCLQEERALSALHHPCVVGVREIFNTGSFDCLVMEYVEGQTLDRLIPPRGGACQQE